MNLSEFCIRRPVFTLLLMAALSIAGYFGYSQLPVSALPNVDFPTLQVTANLPGASAETMASTVATPLERGLSTIAGVSSMTSTSYLGTTQITLQFDLNRDLDGAALDVQSAITAAQSNLPAQMPTPPIFKKVNPADQPVIFLSVASTSLPLNVVNEYADTLMAQRISTLPGVSQVAIYGEQKSAVRIRVNPELLAARDLSLNDVADSVGAMASVVPVGVISGQQQLFNIEVVNQPKVANDFKTMIVSWKKGSPIFLKDIADISDSV
ncbi:MAG: efflux RND transporter permease subunit, partial [Alphaproteobacteria bacterium]|nr:efflux RND transporter permease subunit [Alphaproteobacteria bacterium]